LDLLDLGLDRFDHVGEVLVPQQPEAPGFVHGIDAESVEDDAPRRPEAWVEFGFCLAFRAGAGDDAHTLPG
jgi:hypothetical protein